MTAIPCAFPYRVQLLVKNETSLRILAQSCLSNFLHLHVTDQRLHHRPKPSPPIILLLALILHNLVMFVVETAAAEVRFANVLRILYVQLVIHTFATSIRLHVYPAQRPIQMVVCLVLSFFTDLVHVQLRVFGFRLIGEIFCISFPTQSTDPILPRIKRRFFAILETHFTLKLLFGVLLATFILCLRFFV